MREPAIPTWTTASGVRSASARAVCSAASTGPIPQQKRVEPVEERELALGGRDDEHGERLRVTLSLTLPSRWQLPASHG